MPYLCERIRIGVHARHPRPVGGAVARKALLARLRASPVLARGGCCGRWGLDSTSFCEGKVIDLRAATLKVVDGVVLGRKRKKVQDHENKCDLVEGRVGAVLLRNDEDDGQLVQRDTARTETAPNPVVCADDPVLEALAPVQ